MRHDYLIRADGRAYWYSNGWGSLMFDWDPLFAAPGEPAGSERVSLHELPAKGRTTGWYRLILPCSRRKVACQRVKTWLEAQGKKVVIHPRWLGGSDYGGYVYYDAFGWIRFFSEPSWDKDGALAVRLDAEPWKKESAGIYRWVIPKFRRDAAIHKIIGYIEKLGTRVILK